MAIDARKEEYEHVELFGKPALFTDSRISRFTVPQGWFCYDLRGSDYDPGRPIMVENHVVVNHAGTILTPTDLNSREEFDRIRKVLNNPNARMADYRRAAYYYQLIRYSYSSGLDSFASQPHDIRSDFPLIDMATRRLANVVVEHGSFERVIPHYDRPTSFFYCDPPYHTSEKFYKNIGGFTEKKHILLRDRLLSVKGRFLLSYNDDEFVRELYDHEGIYMLEKKRPHNMRQRFEGGSEFPELLIANYDLNDPSQLLMGQTTLFNMNGGLLLS